MPASWYRIVAENDLPSPALLLYADRVRSNLSQMLAIAGGPARLRPHVKTHKLPPLVRWQLDASIERFKCATLAEAEMLARCGAPDVCLGYPLLGPNLGRFIELQRAFPDTYFSALVDDAAWIERAAHAAVAARQTLRLWLDLDVGMHRTGVAPEEAVAGQLYRRLATTVGLAPAGLHAYDGHLKQRDPDQRHDAVEAAFAPVERLARQLRAAGLPVPAILAGGTPTFALHATHSTRELCPGTCLLWDASYAEKFPDLNFLPAAVLVTRVISKPTPDRLCVDLGYKAVSADNPDPRALFLQIPDARAVIHNEEHLTITTADAGRFAVGDLLYAIPYHVCPTVALQQFAYLVVEGRVVDRWPIVARDRTLTF